MLSKKEHHRHSAPGSSAAKKILPAVALVLAILVVGIGILSVTDIGGDRVLAIATETIKEQTGLLLSVERVKGNPILGYTLVGVSLDRDGVQKQNILAANTLNLRVNFASLLSGSPRLSLLAIGGVNTNLDRLVEEIAALDLPAQDPPGGGDIEIPIDRITLVDSRFDSTWGSIDVSSIGANISGTSMAVDILAAVNGVLTRGNLDADVQGQAAAVRRLDLLVGRGRLTASGNVKPAPGDDGVVALDFQGTLRGMDVSDIAALVPFLSPPDYVGDADLDFTVGGLSSNILMTADLNFKGSRIGGFPLESITSRLRFVDNRFAAENVKATTLGIPIEGEFAMAIRDGIPSIMVKLDGSGVPLAEVARLYPNLGDVSGKIERFTVDIHGLVNALAGAIEFSAPDIALIGKQITNAAAQIRLTRDGSATLNSRFVLEGAQAYVQGTIARFATPNNAELDLTAKLTGLDVKRIEDLIPDGAKHGLSGLLTADLTIKGKAVAPVIGGKLSSPKFTAEGYTLDNPSLAFTYANDTFTLKESSGSWNGLPIKVSGTIGPITSQTPNIAMTAQLSLNTETLRRFVPDVDQYRLRGTINAGVKITGRLPQPNIELVASSESLSVLDAVNARNLEVTTALAGDLSALDKVDLAFKAASVSAGGIGLQNLSATIRKDGQQIRLENASARSGEGSVTGGGTITLGAGAGAPARLNLAFDLNRLDLAPLAQGGGLGMALSGLLSGHLGVTGSSSNPDISFKGQAPSVAIEGMTFTNLTADVSGNAAALKINDFRGNVGGAPLSATGNVSLAEPFRADIDIAGKGLDLASLTEGMPDLKGQVRGNADLQFSLRSTAGGNSGAGSIRSSAVTAFGIKTSDVVMPLTLTGNTLKSEGGTLNLYGGRVTNNLVLDINTMKFTDEINASGVDVNALLQDATGGLGGRITGRGNLSFKITGNLGGTPAYSGSGQFTMGEGSVTGFTGLGLLSTLYGVDGIRYTQITAPLRLETGKLIIAKGASMTPPANDPIYRSAQLAEDGAVTFDQKIYFVVDASVNFQLINALAGGVVGGVDALLRGGSVQNIFSGGNLESVLRGVIGGGRDQGRDTDFRDVTAKATGTFDNPSVSLIRLGQGGQGRQEPTGQTPAVPVQTPSAPAQTEPPRRPEDVIRDSIIDAIIPTRPGQPAQPAQEAPVQENVQPEQPAPAERPIEQRIEDEVRRGLDNLLRRRR